VLRQAVGAERGPAANTFDDCPKRHRGELRPLSLSIFSLGYSPCCIVHSLGANIFASANWAISIVARKTQLWSLWTAKRPQRKPCRTLCIWLDAGRRLCTSCT